MKREMTVEVERGKRNNSGDENFAWIEADVEAGHADICYEYARKLFGPMRPGQKKTFVLTAKEVPHA